jgi:thioredoxin 1
MSLTLIETEEQFKTEVLESDVPVIVDFYADWCGPCKMLLPILEEVSGMVDESTAKIVKVNVDKAGLIPAEFNVRGVPTMVKVAGGEEVDRHVGPLQKMQIIRFINGAE